MSALTYAVAAFILLLCGDARSQDPVFGPQVDIDQDKLFSQGADHQDYLRKAVESGRQFWTTPFTPADGMGEGNLLEAGKSGPRAAQRAWMYPGNPTFPFLRVNGIDSQSCFECHNSIGSYPALDSKSGALTRKPTTVGGPAGFNSDAFINPLFPNPVTLLVRNPPHVFGAGYTQQLASEMSKDLMSAWETAHRLAKLAPGRKITIDLVSKGISFGKIGAVWNDMTKEMTDDFAGVEGVSVDMVVRPFQWKGIASSLRHFVRDALDFHFSLQAVEKVGHQDLDRDGKIDEVSLGNVAAISVFVGLTRPPVMDPITDPNSLAGRGAKIFIGTPENRMCAKCHEPTLELEDEHFYIEKVGIPSVESIKLLPRIPGLIDPEIGELPIQKLFKATLAAAERKAPLVQDRSITPNQMASQIRDTLRTVSPSTAMPGEMLQIELSPKPDVYPRYAYDRLTHRGANGKLQVPLFSDLKRHTLGPDLQDNPSPVYVFPGYSHPGQPTDDPNMKIVVPPDLFLTRPLWGAADTGPWMHDGRARTLEEAIKLHGRPGSEAQDVIAKLQQADIEALVAFLLTLRLPIEK